MRRIPPATVGAGGFACGLEVKADWRATPIAGKQGRGAAGWARIHMARLSILDSLGYVRTNRKVPRHAVELRYRGSFRVVHQRTDSAGSLCKRK